MTNNTTTIKNRYFTAELSKIEIFQDGRAYAVEWEVYETLSYDEVDDVITETEKGEHFANGMVKWDGCSNWKFTEQNCMHHQCGKDGLSAIGEILAACWQASGALMPGTADTCFN
jgi:hypothetical protein